MKIAMATLALAATTAQAKTHAIYTNDATAQEIKRAVEINKHTNDNYQTPLRPATDVDEFEYLLINGYSDFSENIKATIAKNLPAPTKLVVLVDPGDEDSVKQQFSQWISPDRLIIATSDSADGGFWARDSFPYPTYTDTNNTVRLVAAHYYRDFTGQQAIGDSVHAPMVNYSYVFVGGNLLSDEDGNCFAVNSYRLFDVNADIIAKAYGCKTVHIMDHAAGLGDVDEVLKPIGQHRILTNVQSYVPLLQQWGYQVIQLPAVPDYRTYANSVIVRGTVFMPSYNRPEDAQAKAVYEKLGYKVVMIDSEDISENGHGSLHCITMAYPKIDVNVLLQSIGAHVAQP